MASAPDLLIEGERAWEVEDRMVRIKAF